MAKTNPRFRLEYACLEDFLCFLSSLLRSKSSQKKSFFRLWQRKQQVIYVKNEKRKKQLEEKDDAGQDMLDLRDT